MKQTLRRTREYIDLKLKNKHYEIQNASESKQEDYLEELKEALSRKNIEFVDIFHVPMGWETPLFQRFQHMSLNVGGIGGVAFYGAHPTVDKDVKNIKKINNNLYLINYEDYSVKQKFFEIMDSYEGIKVIRLQSIDLATTTEELRNFQSKGYKVLFEYIDEITPDITGDIPPFVLDRHKYVLENEAISVIATSDKLFQDVLKYRKHNCIMSCNGVDYEHWNIDNISMPEDLQKILKKDKILVGYHGALAKWIDYDLLKDIADDGRFQLLLIGYEHDLSLANSGLKKHKNIAYIGHKNYFELNKYCYFYDIAIVPFMVNKVTEAVSPVKLFEYMAAGKPIVTYSLRECKKYEACLIASTKEDFMYNLEKAISLRTNKEYLEILKKEALENTWEEKALEMKKLVLGD